MVDGIDSFREAFKGYEDCYTGIGLDAVKEFVEVITDEKLPLIQLGLPFDADEGIGLLKQLYGV